jgi:hypothetical protein
MAKSGSMTMTYRDTEERPHPRLDGLLPAIPPVSSAAMRTSTAADRPAKFAFEGVPTYWALPLHQQNREKVNEHFAQ